MDRDGVINVDTGYLCDNKKLQFISGSLEAMKILQKNGLTLVIVTNQSGLARGYFSIGDFNSFMAYYFEKLTERGVEKPFLYFCPHHPNGIVESYSMECGCRKPLPGMFFQAALDLKINLQNSFLVGDNFTDIEAGSAAGIPNLFLITKGCILENGNLKLNKTTRRFDSLLSVATSIISELTRN